MNEYTIIKDRCTGTGCAVLNESVTAICKQGGRTVFFTTGGVVNISCTQSIEELSAAIWGEHDG